MNRIDGERVRIAEQAKVLRGLLQGLESCVEDGLPTIAAAQSVAEAAVRLATICARLDAYGLAARDLQPPVCSRCNDTHRMGPDGAPFMCTMCPVPCQECSSGGNGPYCETTPCKCACHARAA